MATDPDTITLHLKGPLLNYKGEPFKDISALQLSQQQIINTPENHLLKIAPPTQLGDQISSFLVGIIQPKDTEDAVKLTRWAAKINNKMITDKGEIQLDEKDLKEILSIFKSSVIPVKNSHLLGSIIIHLEQKEVELNQKKNPDIQN